MVDIIIIILTCYCSSEAALCTLTSGKFEVLHDNNVKGYQMKARKSIINLNWTINVPIPKLPKQLDHHVIVKLGDHACV